MAPRTLVNVNFPALPPDEVKGVRVVRQGLRDYGRLRIVQRTDPRGYDYYWFGLGPMIHTPGHATDLEAIADGYVSVTPLHLDLTHEPSLERARRSSTPDGARARAAPITSRLRRKSPLPVWVADRLARRRSSSACSPSPSPSTGSSATACSDNYDGQVSFLDVIYFTMISITTTGYGDVVPVADHTRHVRRAGGDADPHLLRADLHRHRLHFRFPPDMGQMADGQASAHLERPHRRRRLRHQRLGGGRRADRARRAAPATSSSSIATRRRWSAPNRSAARSSQADATRDKTLQAVHIDRARAMIVSAGSDDTSILITLTARHLAPDAHDQRRGAQRGQ